MNNLKDPGKFLNLDEADWIFAKFTDQIDRQMKMALHYPLRDVGEKMYPGPLEWKAMSDDLHGALDRQMAYEQMRAHLKFVLVTLTKRPDEYHSRGE